MRIVLLLAHSANCPPDAAGIQLKDSTWCDQSYYCLRSTDVQIGYAFLLHLYSSPLTHHRPLPFSSHSRPDVHALFQLWLGLTEVSFSNLLPLSRLIFSSPGFSRSSYRKPSAETSCSRQGCAD